MKFVKLLIIFVLALNCAAHAAPTSDESGLFPRAEPIAEGYLDVGDIHKVFFLTFGNPDGIPVMVLHGGPGAGSYPRLMQYFNPEKYYIVLHDQRGAGKYMLCLFVGFTAQGIRRDDREYKYPRATAYPSGLALGLYQTESRQ